jgi:hypothetical protein
MAYPLFASNRKRVKLALLIESFHMPAYFSAAKAGGGFGGRKKGGTNAVALPNDLRRRRRSQIGGLSPDWPEQSTDQNNRLTRITD